MLTTLKSVGKPVSEIAFPMVTICSPGLFMENVRIALEKSFNQWRVEENKSWEEFEIPNLMAEFMKEKFQIKARNVNIMDILNTMISPKDVETSVAANGVRENIEACAGADKKGRKKREHAVDLAAAADWTTLYESKSEIKLVNKNLLTTLPVLPKTWSVSFEMKMTEMAATNSDKWIGIFQMHVQGTNWPEAGCKVPAVDLDKRDNNKLNIFSAVNGETVSLDQDKITTPALDTWMAIEIAQTEENEIFTLSISIDGAQIYSTENKQPQLFENVEVSASKSVPSGYTGYLRNLLIKGGPDEIAAMQTETIQEAMLQRGCVEISNTNDTTEENPSNLPQIDIFLNPQKESELKQLVGEMMNTSRKYFRSVNMELLYPELFRALWHYTLPCFPEPGVEEAMLRSCAVGQETIPCQAIFRRVPTDSGKSFHFLLDKFLQRDVLCAEL